MVEFYVQSQVEDLMVKPTIILCQREATSKLSVLNPMIYYKDSDTQNFY